MLACGDQARLSHDSAAALYGLRDWPRVPEVTCPTRHQRPGIRTHRSLTLRRDERSRQFGIPVTTVARTIRDILTRLTDAQLIQAIGDARRAGRLGADELRRLIAASVRIARLIDPAQSPSESMLMARFQVFEEDRRRDAVALKHGHVTVRITSPRLAEQPVALAAQLRTILERERERERAPDATELER